MKLFLKFIQHPECDSPATPPKFMGQHIKTNDYEMARLWLTRFMDKVGPFKILFQADNKEEVKDIFTYLYEDGMFDGYKISLNFPFLTNGRNHVTYKGLDCEYVEGYDYIVTVDTKL